MYCNSAADINARDYAGRQARDVVKETAAADIKGSDTGVVGKYRS